MSFLLGLGIINCEKRVANNADNVSRNKSTGCTLSFTRKEGHLLITWTFSFIFFTRSELRSFHNHLFHPSTRKLFILSKKPHSKHATPKAKKFIDEIQKQCSNLELEIFLSRATIIKKSPHSMKSLSIKRLPPT